MDNLDIWAAQFDLEIFFFQIKTGHTHGWIGKGARFGQKWRRYDPNTLYEIFQEQQQCRRHSDHPSEMVGPEWRWCWGVAWVVAITWRPTQQDGLYLQEWKGGRIMSNSKVAGWIKRFKAGTVICWDGEAGCRERISCFIVMQMILRCRLTTT